MLYSITKCSSWEMALPYHTKEWTTFSINLFQWVTRKRVKWITALLDAGNTHQAGQQFQHMLGSSLFPQQALACATELAKNSRISWTTLSHTVWFWVVLCKARSWTQGSSQVPPNSGDSMILQPLHMKIIITSQHGLACQTPRKIKQQISLRMPQLAEVHCLTSHCNINPPIKLTISFAAPGFSGFSGCSTILALCLVLGK